MATRIWIGTDAGNQGDLNTAANWSGAAVPIAGDDVYFNGSSTQNVTGSLTALSAVALTSLTIDQDYTGTIGTESSFMACDPGTLTIGGSTSGLQTAAGSGRINLDLGSNQQTVVVINTANTATDTNRMPVRLLMNNVSNAVHVRRGKVAIEDNPGDAGQLSTLEIDQDGPGSTSTRVIAGAGLTMATVTVKAGTAYLHNAITTLNVLGGTAYTEGSGAITTLNVGGTKPAATSGKLVSNSTGTITTLNLYKGTADFTDSEEARTVTNFNWYGGTFSIPTDLTLTNNIVPSGTGDMTGVAS